MTRILPPWLRTKRLVTLALAAVLVPVLLMVAAAVFDVKVEVDAAWALAGLAGVVLALGVVEVVRYRLRARETVSVGYRVKLDQPLMPVVGRYSFQLEVFYDVETKGERARVDQGSIELKFRRADHPELMDWCRERIVEHLEKHAAFALERYPDARVVLPPAPSEADLFEARADEDRPVLLPLVAPAH